MAATESSDWRVEMASKPGAGTSSIMSSRVRSPLPNEAPIGRADEVETLVEGFRRSAAGDPRGFLVSGAAGVGKTTLVGEAARRAEESGATVLWGRCWEDGHAPPFWPWLEILRQATELRAEEVDGDVARALLDAIQGGFENPRGGAPEGSEIARFLLYDRISRFLSTVSHARPLVIVIDDVHNADAPSLRLLQFVLQAGRGRRIAIFLTRRDSEPVEGEARQAVLGALVQETTAIHLAALPIEDARLLLERHAARPLADEFVAMAWEKTRGNPLFLALLGQSTRWKAAPIDEPSPWKGISKIPSVVREVITGRLTRMDPSARSMLELAAVIGDEFDLPLLLKAHALAGSAPGSDGTSDAIIRAWGDVEASGVVQVGYPAGSWRFLHGIVRDVVYESLPETNRMRLHAAVGRACEALDPTLENRLEQTGHHLAVSAPFGTAERAVELLLRCGRHAIHRYAHENAATILARALRVARESGETRLVREILLALGEAQLRGTAIDEAKRSLEEAIAIARSTGDAETLGRAALLLADVGTGLPLDVSREGRVGLVVLEALQGLDEADSPLRAILMTRVASLLFESLPGDERTRLAMGGLEMARRIGDPTVVGHALCDVHAALWDPGNAVERLGWTSEALRLARDTGDDALALRAHVSRILALSEFGDPIALDVEVPRLDEYARRLGEPRCLWLSTHMRALEAVVRGRFAEAEQLATEAFSQGERARDPRALSFVSLVMEVLRLHQGRLAEFEPMIRANVFDGDDLSVRLGIGLLAAELDRPVEARAVVDSLRRSGRVEMSCDPRAALVMAGALAQTVVFLEDAEAARTVHEMLRPHDGRWVALQHLGTMIDAPVAFYLGMLEATFGDTEAAEEHFESSLASSDRLRARPARARTLLALGRMLRRRGLAGDELRAHRALEEALSLATDMGMLLVAQRAKDALADLSGGLPREGAADESSGATAPSRTTHGVAPLAPESTKHPGRDRRVFRRRGEVWEVCFAGREKLYPHVRGFEMLAVLLSRPHSPVACEELQAIGRGAETEPGSGLRETLIDPPALSEYRARLRELHADLDEANRENDLGRSERLAAEVDFLEGEIERSVGRSGRLRVGGDAERARVNVRRAIALALDRLGSHEELSAHLDRTISTGRTCSYDPDSPVTWETGSP